MTAPRILWPGKFTADDLHKLKQEVTVWQVVDIYEQQLAELHEIAHPDHATDFRAFAQRHDHGDLAGAWVYYPWSGVMLHCVGPQELQVLRTNRNQNLVTSAEQQTIADSVVGVAGMSVGAGIALGCAHAGIGTMKIADFDSLATSNLNRLRESLSHVGQPKEQLAAQRIYELNPFADVREMGGITDATIDGFFTDPKLSVVLDEIDDFKMKVALRLKARETGVPLLMFTSLGDNILVDVERYDQDQELAIFNGAIGTEAEAIMEKSDISDEDAKRFAVSIVGPQYVPTRALGSVAEVGKSLVGRPQLYSTIAVDGGLATYLVNSIVLGVPLASGRYFIKFAELFGMASQDLADSAERQRYLQALMRPH